MAPGAVHRRFGGAVLELLLHLARPEDTLGRVRVRVRGRVRVSGRGRVRVRVRGRGRVRV